MDNRSLAVITGAAGGVGQAVARALGSDRRLILTDVNGEGLAQLSRSLEAEGVSIAGTVAGPIQDPDLLDRLEARLPAGRSVGVLVHAAGLSPMQCDWRTSIMVNAVGTRRLMARMASRIAPGGVAVLLSSLAGHAPLPVTGADRLLEEDWDRPDLTDHLAAFIEALPEVERSGRAYALSKRLILRLCERLGVEWARQGSRIVSISPGIIDTPMGQLEVQASPVANELLARVPLGGFVTARDIAGAVQFFVSPAARFITGTDLKIDGGLYAATMAGVPSGD